MTENKKRPNLSEKLKNTKISRATIITSVLLLAALTIIISVTIASNRAKKKNDPPAGNEPSVTEPADTQAPTPDETTPETLPQEKPNNSTSSQVGNKLPSFVLPVNGVLSKKHDPKIQVYSNTMNDYRVHLGVDIVTEENAPVYAAADGTVSKIWKDTLMGYCIAIKHSGDSYTIYKNLAETLPDGIKEGTAVRSGQLIASVGESAMIEVAEEPHLHFEMTVADLAVNPLEYFNEKALASLSIDASFGE